MLLRMLRDRGGESSLPPGYQMRPIRAFVDVDSEGQLRGLTDNADANAKRGQHLPVPSLKRSSAARPILLADGPDYLFGIADDETSAKLVQRAEARRDLHLELLKRCVDTTGSTGARAALTFLTGAMREGQLRQTIAASIVEYPGDLALRVADHLVTDELDVQRFWAATVGLAGAGDGAARCSVCGQGASIPEMLPVPIKGLQRIGGQTSGAQLVSMNSDAFESYAQTRATGAAVCGPCGEQIANALNALLADPRHVLFLRNVAYVTWHTGDETFDIFELLRHPQPELVRHILDSPLTARADILSAETGDLVTLALSANAARVVVREWDVVPVPVLRKRLRAYFAAQAVVGPWGEAATAVKLAALEAATAREPRDVSASTSIALLHAILAGKPPPCSLAASVIRRITVEDAPKVTQPQAALLTWFLSQPQEDFVVPHELDPSLDRAAYHWGRALAEIDSIQRLALGKSVGATVVDRYFGAASSRPSTVFGMLIGGAQHHLAKLRRDNEPAANARSRRLEETLDRLRLQPLPNTLSLADQTLFCLGFYHQRADDRRAAAAQGRGAPAGAQPVVNGPAIPTETAS